MGNIKDYLPKKEDVKNLQVKMSKTLVEQVQLAMKEDNISWNELLTACFRNYLDSKSTSYEFEKREGSHKSSPMSKPFG